MNTYAILLRGINVGGKNKLPMADLRSCLEALGYTHVITLIASGNVVVTSSKSPAEVKDEIEAVLPQTFKLDSELIKVLVLTRDQLQAALDSKPKGFGEQPGVYHTDMIFLMGIDVAEAMTVFSPREGVDKVWPGPGVIYSQRLTAELTKSRLGKIVGTLPYKSMTIRTFNTAQKLLALMDTAGKE